MAHLKHDLGIAKQIAAYTDAVEVTSGARWLMTSATPGINTSGELASDFTGQAEQAWQNIFDALDRAGMLPADLVKTTTYLTDPGDIAAYGKVRTRFLAGVEAASLLLVVDQLVRPEFKIAIEAIAAKT